MFEIILFACVPLFIYLIPAEEKVHEVVYTNEIFAMVSPELEKVSLGKVCCSRCIRLTNENMKSQK